MSYAGGRYKNKQYRYAKDYRRGYHNTEQLVTLLYSAASYYKHLLASLYTFNIFT